jgi:hypothetical protein
MEVSPLRGHANIEDPVDATTYERDCERRH